MERVSIWMTVIIFGGGTVLALSWLAWALIKSVVFWGISG
jgi:hypothetical protein